MSDGPLSEEDKLLFRELMRDVKPLSGKKKVVIKEKVVPAVSRRKLDVVYKPIKEVVYLSSQYSEVVYADTVLSYRFPGIPAKRFNQIKKGEVRWDARLDLHGLNVDLAADTLRSFILKQQDLDHRNLLIIHGKGGHLGDVSTLKSYVNHWLKQFPGVIAFHSALARDGGTGSVYVLLKRNRD